MSNKPLRLAQSGTRPRIGAKKIINSHGAVVGYIKGNTIYAGDMMSDREGACGYLDSNKNLFDIYGRYVGTVRRGATINLGIALVIVVLLVALLGCSLYYSGYIMQRLGLSVYNPQYPSIVLAENGQSWDQLDRLDIFGGGADGRNDNAFVKRAIIPGTVGEYNFVIKNDSDKSIKYNVTFTDENEYRIPMRYRLQSNNAYIVGGKDNWVTVNELMAQDLTLLPGSSNLYTLEWKWAADVDDAADTAAGTSGMTYVLNISLSATLNF